MSLELESHAPADYLNESAIINYSHPRVAEVALSLAAQGGSRLDLARRTYEFVRDAIHHSADIEGKTVTCAASEVLAAGEGLCYAKSHLLAALLRHNGIPAGFCYQLLQSQINPAAPLVLHGLIAVYIDATAQWIRIDPRGNKPGINAQFSLDKEQLAYAVHPEKGETLFPTVFVAPDPNVVLALRSHSMKTIWLNLPQQLQ